MKWLVRLGVIALALCAQPAMAKETSAACINGIAHFLSVEPAPARQGATLRLTPIRGPGYAQEAEPGVCITGWALSDPKLARFTPDHSAIIIADDATPGAKLTISYRTRDPKVALRNVTATLTIVARDAVVLTGTRGQSGQAGCDGVEPIGEMKFAADGTFAVTFQPFETYVDYWGTYRFDPVTGALTLTVTGGNFQPPRLMLNGTARLEGKHLVLEGMFLGSRSDFAPPASGCTYRF